MGVLLQFAERKDAILQRRAYANAVSTLQSTVAPFVLPYIVSAIWLSTFLVYEYTACIQRNSFYRSTLGSSC